MVVFWMHVKCQGSPREHWLLGSRSQLYLKVRQLESENLYKKNKHAHTHIVCIYIYTCAHITLTYIHVPHLHWSSQNDPKNSWHWHLRWQLGPLGVTTKNRSSFMLKILLFSIPGFFDISVGLSETEVPRSPTKSQWPAYWLRGHPFWHRPPSPWVCCRWGRQSPGGDRNPIGTQGTLVGK